MSEMTTEQAADALVGHSPFPPIADYGFLSDCESTALVSPGGNVEWMCLPRMDSPSVFGAILDRGAGGFRLGPADMAVPVARRYLPGTMILETSWGTPTGWIIVRDALLIGPWHHEGELSHTHRRAPTDYDAEHVLLRTIRCVNGEVQITMDCEPLFDYGREAGAMALHRLRLSPGRGDRPGYRPDAAAHVRPAHRFRGPEGRRPHAAEGGRFPFRRPDLDRAPAAVRLRRGLPAHGLDRAPLAALAGPRPLPGSSVAPPPAAQRADPQRADLCPERGTRGGRDHLTAGDARRRAQLGLPLQLDPGLHLHAVGPVFARLRLGGRRLLLLHRRHRRP